MNKKNFVILLVLSTALTSSAIALVSSRAASTRTRNKTSRPATPGVASALRANQAEPLPDDRVRRESLSSQLHGPFQTLGDRLEKRGKERVAVTGTLRRSGEEQEIPFGLIWEPPGRLRLEIVKGAQQQITIFDGSRAMGTGGINIEGREEDLLETLLYDSAEHFFVSQMQGAATRFLGSRFRLIEDSRAEYSGPVYDVFEVTEAIITSRREAREQTRQFFFNSNTQLLEVVKYRVSDEGSETQVEVRLEKWQQVNGQRFPSRIVRLENDKPVLALVLNLASVTVSAKGEDGLFSQAANQ